MNKREIGKLGEDCAEKYLISHGYEIIDRNFFCRKGEIDIIAKLAETIIFIEVKARKNNNFGTAAEAVTFTKQEKIVIAAKMYIQYKALNNYNFRFDVIEVSLRDNLFQVKNHIINAFEV